LVLNAFDLLVYLEVFLLVSLANHCWQLASILLGVPLGPCADLDGALPGLAQVPEPMAASTSAGSGIPLDEYRKDVPPGWEPGNPRYPLKQYLERIKMWYRLYDGPD